jgi:hypothetical protein
MWSAIGAAKLRSGRSTRSPSAGSPCQQAVTPITRRRRRARHLVETLERDDDDGMHERWKSPGDRHVAVVEVRTAWIAQEAEKPPARTVVDEHRAQAVLKALGRENPAIQNAALVVPVEGFTEYLNRARRPGQSASDRMHGSAERHRESVAHAQAALGVAEQAQSGGNQGRGIDRARADPVKPDRLIQRVDQLV